MKEKANETTPQRTEEKRVIHAPMLEMDLNASIDQIKGEAAWLNNDRNALTIFKSDTMRIVLMALRESAELKPHKANGVISVQVLKGKINFMTEQQSAELGKGQMIALEENIVHSVKALEESFFLLTLSISSK
jgi:quercetin dioxygenase-like cupin family protein